jgi:prevent-host-death family protein
MQTEFSSKINAYEAKTRFAEVLRRVEQGERITIFRHNIPIAVLSPIPDHQISDIDETIEHLISFAQSKILEDIALKNLVMEDGK